MGYAVEAKDHDNRSLWMRIFDPISKAPEHFTSLAHPDIAPATIMCAGTAELARWWPLGNASDTIELPPTVRSRNGPKPCLARFA
eukprot:6195783-Pyramimonas_sp.AAC.1